MFCEKLSKAVLLKGTMLKNTKIILLSFIIIIFINACKKPAPQAVVIAEKSPVLQIGNEDVSIEDFKTAYEKYKNETDSLVNLTPEAYLKIFTETKLKIKSAKTSGKDTTSDYKEEIDTYKKQLAKNFLKDDPLINKMAQEAYSRMKQEVNASHILIAVPEDADPKDTLSAYRAAVAMKGRLKEGSNFEEMATQFSADPTAKINHGNLGNFTALQMLYPLEQIAFSAPIGKISDPVRSRNGFHLVRVNSLKANRGLVKVAHIMLKLDSTDSETKKEITSARIYEAFNKLEKGASWSAMVQEYSEDGQSKVMDGILPMFGVGQMVTEIENAAFNLTEAKPISSPIQTIYGWHILKLISKQGIEPYENLEAYLKQKVVTDTRGKVIFEAKANRLKKTYKPTEFDQPWKEVQKLVDSTLLTGKWDYVQPVNQEWNKVILFAIGSENYNAAGFLDYVKAKQSPAVEGSSPLMVFKRHYQEYLTDRLQKYEIEHLDEINPKFRELIGDIKEGILINQGMEEEVWQKSILDSVGQLAIYEKNKLKYQLPERALGTIITAVNSNSLKKFLAMTEQKPFLLERKSPEILFDENTSTLPPNSKALLTEILTVLKSNPSYSIEIAGYRTNEEGMKLSSERIKNIVNFLSANNISLVRIIEKDYSSFRPSDDVARNRRVSFQFFTESLKDLEKVFNEDNSEKIAVEEGYFTKDHKIITEATWKTGNQTITGKSGISNILIDKIEPARLKKLSEARGSVINDYQKELEKAWIEKLKKQYPVKVNVEELEKVAP